jgi:hypothetical protein
MRRGDILLEMGAWEGGMEWGVVGGGGQTRRGIKTRL